MFFGFYGTKFDYKVNAIDIRTNAFMSKEAAFELYWEHCIMTGTLQDQTKFMLQPLIILEPYDRK
jgi:hypothetical protein